MSSRYSFARLAVALVTLAAQVHAEDCQVAVVLGHKPAMDEYVDYSDFLVAIMDYKARERAREYQQENCPELVAAAESGPPVTDPTVIVGPETLESAVARSRRLPRFDYSRQRWHNRTTSRSFSLPTLPGSQLESEAVRTRLATLEGQGLPPRLQQLVLNLQSPLPRTEDATEAVSGQARYFLYTQPIREQEVSTAFAAAAAYRPFVYALVSEEGNLIMFLDDDYDLARSLAQIDTCLGGC